MSDTNGGFEVDGPVWKRLVGASGSPTDTSENSRLRQGEWLFSPLYSHKTCAYRCGLQLMTCSGMCVVFRVTEEIVGQVLSYQTGVITVVYMCFDLQNEVSLNQESSWLVHCVLTCGMRTFCFCWWMINSSVCCWQSWSDWVIISSCFRLFLPPQSPLCSRTSQRLWRPKVPSAHFRVL